MKAKEFASFALVTMLFPISVNASPDVGHGVMAYDNVYNNTGETIGIRPGLFALSLADFISKTAGKEHTLSMMYTYGGELRMYCRGSGGSSPNTPCGIGTLEVGVNWSSVQAYDAVVNKTATMPLKILPIIEGKVGDQYLRTFNQLDPTIAQLYADHVAKVYCANADISGLVFALDGIDMKQPGQAEFFKQIAKDLAGKNDANGPDPLHCVNDKYPVGRMFGVVMNVEQMDYNVASTLNEYENGYVIIRLENLYNRSTPWISATDPEVYKVLAKDAIQAAMKKSAKFKLMYKFAVPVSASQHEYEFIGNIPSGFNMLSYLRNALAMIDASNARNDIFFLGVDLIASKTRTIINGVEYSPSAPTIEIMNYLLNTL